MKGAQTFALTPTTTRNLAADLNDEDDEGLDWSTLSEAAIPAGSAPG
jgi:hypothetical protein